ncbi:FAD-dependent monooxygenase [Mycolicibacterium septicum]|uniref:FAD-dependent monooxygenase n=1 Tax=Mycolicibacterium septicum TaxID=98668 RepID=UPI0023E0C233|nr:FAD-dependent monooxygenase [Mycolicibacterium septicum]MDF3337118.1 FAD-dependent monooxygenase [Mycolicibacterium septicum]
MRVLVVGGGIGGVATALSLARQGSAVRVLERASVIEEVGAGLQVGPNAWRALTRLGVVERLETAAVRPGRAVMKNIHTGDEITSLDFGPRFVARYGAPYTVLHRADLLSALVDACAATGRVELTTGCEVVKVRQGADVVSVECADGSTDTADALIGADGLRSTVRRLVVDDALPVVDSYVVYRGPGPRPEGVEDAVTLYVGDGLHYMQYPVRGGEVLNRVASFKPQESGDADEFLARFDRTCDYVRAAIGEFDLNKQWPLCDREPLGEWAVGRITLLGDAAHPMHQYLAQGACQALEDAVVLGASIAESGTDIEGALKKYEAIRFPRASRVQRVTRQMGELCHLGGVGAALRDHVLSTRAVDDYQHVDWLYGEGEI